MATLDEMTRAGYKPVEPKKSTADQILGMLQGAGEQIAKQKEAEKKDVMDQVKLYGELRQAGYSKEEAHAKVSHQYRTTNFIEKLVNGEKPGFVAPTEDDAQTIASRKSKAEIGKTKAETRKITAQGQYYERGGPSGYKGLQNLTPNQIQTRIKDLRGQLGMGEQEDDANINSEISYLNDLFNKKSGFRQEEEPQIPENSPTAEANAQMKKTFGAKATATTVVMTGPDGKKYRIPKQNEERARKNGFK